MTILEYLRTHPGKHTAKEIAEAIGRRPYFVRLELADYVKNYMIIGHEQHGKMFYEHKEPNA